MLPRLSTDARPYSHGEHPQGGREQVKGVDKRREAVRTEVGLVFFLRVPRGLSALALFSFPGTRLSLNLAVVSLRFGDKV